MKMTTEFIKIALLIVIVVILSLPSSTNLSKKSIPGKDIANSDEDKELVSEENSRKHDLQKIMEYNLAKLFKFPESVRYENTRFEYKRLFKDNGINIALEKELEFATLCGHYSARNAMGVYGPSAPFYAEVAVSNKEKGITGDLWLEIDGEIKHLTSLDSSVYFDGDRTKFRELYEKNCKDADKAYMGEFIDYDIGYDALGIEQYFDYIDKISKYPGAQQSLKECVEAGALIVYCIGSELCRRPKEPDKVFSEFCAIKTKVCSTNDKPKECESKLKTAFEKKK